MTYFLRFSDQASGLAALLAAGFIDSENNVLTCSHNHSIDVIGTIYRGGSYDFETNEVITPPTQLSGWHCNFIGDLPEGWDNYLVYPQHPSRVFAGTDAGTNLTKELPVEMSAATGLPDPTAQVTERWAIPQQIADGRWVFASPDDEGVEADPGWWSAGDVVDGHQAR